MEPNLHDRASAVVDKYITTANLKKHLYAVEALMLALALKLNPDVTDEAARRELVERWGMVGLLHDFDWDITHDDPKTHGLVGAQILEKANTEENAGFSEEVIRAIKAHNPMTGTNPETLMEKALYYTEEVTGLIVANALVLPSRKLADVTVDSVLRKMKEKSFARGVNREIINEGPKHLNMTLEEIIQTAITSMQNIHTELGL